MATCSDNHGIVMDSILTCAYDDNFIGPHIFIKLGSTTINIQPSPSELYHIYKWTIVQMDKIRKLQRKQKKK